MPTFSVLQGSEGEWTSDKTVEILGKEFQHISSLILSCFVMLLMLFRPDWKMWSL